jgi:hypothetical protein
MARDCFLFLVQHGKKYEAENSYKGRSEMSSSSSSCRSQGRKLFEQSLSTRNERLVENETTPLLVLDAAESPSLPTEQNAAQSPCLLAEEGGAWMRRVWRLRWRPLFRYLACLSMFWF